MDRFQRASQAGSTPRIEDFLAEVSEQRRAMLLEELLLVELESRQNKSDEPAPGEYRKRFPDHRAEIDAAFARAANARVNPAPKAAVEGSAAKAAPARPIPPELASNADYEIIRELGSGGMGLVFLAHNHIMGRDEVLKIISREIIGNPGVLDRFLREIRAVAALEHPNIVMAYSAFRAGESLVFAMEYAEGLDLARLVKAKGALPVGHACSFIHQAALGLQHAHEAGMVHRDIKPGNLMLSYQGNRALIKILDFGLAKATSEKIAGELGILPSNSPDNDNPFVTGSGQMLGTPGFIAPEQIVNAQRADIRADIYSLGCTLYFLLSGRAPFQGTTVYDTLVAHRSAAATPLNEVRSDVAAELAAIVTRMMAKKPRLRFETPAEVSKALAPFFKASSVAAKAVDGPARESVAERTATKAAGEPSANAAEAIVPETLPWRPENEWVPAAAVELPAELVRLKPNDDGPIELNVTSEDDGWEDTASATRAADSRRRRWLVGAAGIAGLAAVLAAALYLSGILADLWLEQRAGRRNGLEPPVVVTEFDATDLPGNDRTDTVGTPVSGSVPKAAVVLPTVPPRTIAPPGAGEPAAAVPAPTVAAAPSTEKTETPKAVPTVRLSKFEQDVDRAIRAGVRYLQSLQRADGSWTDLEVEAKTGTTSLLTLALLAAGESPDSPAVRKALANLRGFNAVQLGSTYAIALQTLVFATAVPDQDRPRIAANVEWLERAQIKPADRQLWPGTWTYGMNKKTRPGDNSNTQFALAALHAAREAGATVKPEVWCIGTLALRQKPAARRELGLHSALGTVHREHDRRGSAELERQPLWEHSVAGPGGSLGRSVPRLRQEWRGREGASGAQLAERSLPCRPEFRRGAAMEVLLLVRT